MSNRRHIKGNLRRSDYLRALLTDTSPYEVPLIVSNDGFYKNLSERNGYSPVLKEFIETFIVESEPHYTVPYRYKIEKDAKSVRQLSLIHPTSQYKAVEFYQRYDTLITYYCSLGDFSIRRPSRNGSSFFFKSPAIDANKYRNNRIDIDELDKFVRNPASFFSYSGVERLYKFFSSAECARLEKKYPRMMLMDISKCFSSIYSHSISWSIKGPQHSKDNNQAKSFGNDFDKLMHKMNFNETNGICIGPEISRIFSEIILNAVDLDISRKTASVGLINGRDYQCKRYVDDFIVFSSNINTEESVRRIVSECLSAYNLHLNDEKTELYSRPFLTPKSHIINSAKERLNKFFDGFIEKIDHSKFIIPKRIYRPDSLVRALVSSIKSVCYDAGVGYDMVANYIISSLVKRIELIIDSFDNIPEADRPHNSIYTVALMRLLEAVFFFYTVQPTVASSYNVGRAIIVLWRFLNFRIPEETLSASGQIQRWVGQLVRQHSRHNDVNQNQKIPIEFLNVVLAAGEIDQSQMIDQSLLREFIFTSNKNDYFSIVSCLFYIKNRSAYDILRQDTEEKIVKTLNGCAKIRTNSHDAHLALDAICCPYLSMPTRTAILGAFRNAIGLPIRTQNELEADVNEMQLRPWFVQWERLDILNMVKKKELSSVY